VCVCVCVCVRACVRARVCVWHSCDLSMNMSIIWLLVRRSCSTSTSCCRQLHTSVRWWCSNSAPSESVKHCYAVLNVSPSCSSDELRDAYLKLVKDYHPDSISGHANADKFAQVEDAYRRILVSIYLLCGLYLHSVLALEPVRFAVLSF